MANGYILGPGQNPNDFLDAAAWDLDSAAAIRTTAYDFTTPMGGGGTLPNPIATPPYIPTLPGSNIPGGQSPCDFFDNLSPAAAALLGCGGGNGFQTVQPGGTLQVNVGACQPGYTLRKKPKRCASRFGECVPRRHMNPTNIHALRRSTRRIGAFYNAVKSTEKAVRHALSGSGITRHSSPKRGCGYCGKSARSCKCG